MRKKIKDISGFTLLELIVVVLIIGIMTAIAIPQYTKSLEMSKADDARAVVKMIGTTNRMFQLDNDNYAAGIISNSCNTSATKCSTTGKPSACMLIHCRYLATQDWDSKGFRFRAVNGNGQTCSLSNKKSGYNDNAKYVACAKRCTGASPCSNSAKYGTWGFTMDTNGVVTPWGVGIPDFK